MVCCKSCYSLKIPGTWLEFDDLDSSVSYFVEDSISWHNEAKKIAEDQVKFIHPKWNMEFKSMTFKELVGEEE